MCPGWPRKASRDRKSTRLNSSHSQISYAVFCLKKKAVGIGHDEAARFSAPSLALQQLHVIGIDFRNYQRDIAFHANSAGISNDRASSVGKLRLEFGGNRGVERSKNHFWGAVRLSRRDLHLRYARGNGRFQLPARRLAVRATLRTIGRG